MPCSRITAMPGCSASHSLESVDTYGRQRSSGATWRMSSNACSIQKPSTLTVMSVRVVGSITALLYLSCRCTSLIEHEGPGGNARGYREPLQHAAAHRLDRCAAVLVRPLGPAGADGGVGVGHVVAGGLHLLAVGIGLLVDHREVAPQLGDELLAGHRTGPTPEIAGGQHVVHDRLMLSLQGGGLGADQRAVRVDVTELVVNGHFCHLSVG